MTELIGAQIAEWRRRRGKSQRVLAGLAGISQPYLSKIEQGDKPVNRRSTLVALARALEVSVSALTGEPGDPTDPARAAATAYVPAIREALIRREHGEFTDAHHDITELLEAGSGYDFARAAALMPGMITGTVGVTFIKVAYEGMAVLRHLGYRDLAREGVRLAAQEAHRLGSPAWTGVTAYMRGQAMPPEIAGIPTRIASAAADKIQPHAGDAGARQVYGMLHLQAALRAAVDLDPATAHSHLAEARDAARSLGEPDGFGLARMAFGPTNVAMWTTAVELELGEPGRAVETAEGTTAELIPLASRRAPFYADKMAALAAVGRDDEAIHAFLQAESAGPQWVRLRPAVRDTVSSVIRRRRRGRVTPGMRRAARAVGLPDPLRA